jgi:hypothetical protein
MRAGYENASELARCYEYPSLTLPYNNIQPHHHTIVEGWGRVSNNTSYLISNIVHFQIGINSKHQWICKALVVVSSKGGFNSCIIPSDPASDPNSVGSNHRMGSIVKEESMRVHFSIHPSDPSILNKKSVTATPRRPGSVGRRNPAVWKSKGPKTAPDKGSSREPSRDPPRDAHIILI